MSYVIVVLEHISEATYFFGLKVEDDDYQKLLNLSGKYQGIVGDEGVDWYWLFHEMLTEDRKIKAPFTCEEPVTIVHTGFV